jgi:hypothetical protein
MRATGRDIGRLEGDITDLIARCEGYQGGEPTTGDIFVDRAKIIEQFRTLTVTLTTALRQARQLAVEINTVDGTRRPS